MLPAFEARMQEVIPAYRPRDRVELRGEELEVSSYHREGMPGYWLKGSEEELFLPRTGAGRVFGHRWGSSAHVFFSLVAIFDLAGPLWLHSRAGRPLGPATGQERRSPQRGVP